MNSMRHLPNTGPLAAWPQPGSAPPGNAAMRAYRTDVDRESGRSNDPSPVEHIRGGGLVPAGLHAARKRRHVRVQALGVAQQLRHIKQLRKRGVRLGGRLHLPQQRVPCTCVACTEWGNVHMCRGTYTCTGRNRAWRCGMCRKTQHAGGHPVALCAAASATHSCVDVERDTRPGGMRAFRQAGPC